MKMLNESELSTVAGGHHHRRHDRREREEGGRRGGLDLGDLLGGLSITGPVTQVNEAVIVQIMLGSGTQVAGVGQGNSAA